jgi:hypothetical protein
MFLYRPARACIGPRAVVVARLAAGRLQIEPTERHSIHHRAHVFAISRWP